MDAESRGQIPKCENIPHYKLKSQVRKLKQGMELIKIKARLTTCERGREVLRLTTRRLGLAPPGRAEHRAHSPSSQPPCAPGSIGALTRMEAELTIPHSWESGTKEGFRRRFLFPMLKFYLVIR